MALSSIWANLPNERLVGLGYALPWLERFGARRRAHLRLHAGHAGRGALAARRRRRRPRWCSTRNCRCRCLDRPDDAGAFAGACGKPARDAEGDLARAVAGRAASVIVVPNRRGVWARFEHTPFGTGRPFSRGQLNELLRDANFTPAASSDALFFPPSKRRFMMRLQPMLERTGPPALADFLRRHRRRGAEAALSGPAARAARLPPRLRAGAQPARGGKGIAKVPAFAPSRFRHLYAVV